MRQQGAMKTSITWSPAAGLNVVSVERREQAWTVTVDSRQPTFCPGCGAQSKSRHSTYWRTLWDLSAQGAPVIVNARLGRWRCRNQLCDRRIFTERVPSLAAPFARRTARLAGALSHQPFLLISTYRFAGAGFNKVNGLGIRSRTASAPILARCDNAPRSPCAKRQHSRGARRTVTIFSYRESGTPSSARSAEPVPKACFACVDRWRGPPRYAAFV
jgi:hypothetical protein